MMNARLPMTGLLVLLVGFGLFGILQPGPAAGETTEAVEAHFATVPLKIGTWDGVDGEKTDKDSKDLRIAGAKASMNRRYRNAAGDEVNLLVLYGKPADLGAHSPQVCYKGIGFRECSSQARKTFGTNATLWFTRFENERAIKDRLAVYWGWGTGGDWEAADNPRANFSDQAMIYKVYVQRSTGDVKSSTDEDPALKEFVGLFLKELSARIPRKVS